MSTRLRFLYRAYRYRYLVDRAELQFVCAQLQPGQVAVDVGCHKGAYMYWMRRRVGTSGSVFAVEPQPQQVAYVRKVCAAMRYDNVVIVPTGLSSSAGQMTLHIPAGAGQTHNATFERGARNEQRGARSEERGERNEFAGPALRPPGSLLVVDVTTLDKVFADQPRGPNFVKIDVEGHESEVLSGAAETLAKYRPALLVECEARHRRDGNVQPVFELLKALGYEGSFFESGRRRPLSEFDQATHQRQATASGQLPRSYVNNFAFEWSSR